MQGPCYSSNRLISCVFYSSLYGFPGEAFVYSTNPTCNPFNTLSHVPVGQQTVLHLRPRHCLCYLHVALPPRGKHSCSSLAYPTVVWFESPFWRLLLAFVIYCYILLRFVIYCYILLRFVIYCYILLRFVIYCYILLRFVIYCYILLRFVIYCYILLRFVIYCYILLRFVIYCYILLRFATSCVFLLCVLCTVMPCYILLFINMLCYVVLHIVTMWSDMRADLDSKMESSDMRIISWMCGDFLKEIQSSTIYKQY